MELKNANFNGCNAVIKSLHLIFLIFFLILKTELNKGLQSLFAKFGKKLLRQCSWSFNISLGNLMYLGTFSSWWYV